MTDAFSETARQAGESVPSGQEQVPGQGGQLPGEARRDNEPEPVLDMEDTGPAMAEDTIPAPDDLTDSAIDLSRIAWAITTLAFLLAMVVLLLRGDIGYAGVTLAVAIAAAINLF